MTNELTKAISLMIGGLTSTSYKALGNERYCDTKPLLTDWNHNKIENLLAYELLMPDLIEKWAKKRQKTLENGD